MTLHPFSSDLDHTHLDFWPCWKIWLWTYLLVASRDLKLLQDHYNSHESFHVGRSHHGLITKPELLRTRFSRLFWAFWQEVDGSHLAGRYQHFWVKQGGAALRPAYRMLKTEVTWYMQQLMVLATSNGRLQARYLAILRRYFHFRWSASTNRSTDFLKISWSGKWLSSRFGLMIGDSLTADIQVRRNDCIWFNPKGFG